MITKSEDWDVFYRFGAALQKQALRKWGALSSFGCPSAANLIDDAIRLSERFRSNGPLPELLWEKETIEEAEDISYEKLVDHIRAHYHEYSIDIRPMMEPADRTF